MREKYIKRPIGDIESVEYFIQKGLPQNIAEAVSARGVTKDNFDAYFGQCFHSPFEMKNMQEAAEVISYVLEEGGNVLIYGDYDTDGLTASSILSLFFTDNGIDNDVIIPTREQGYGLHADLVIDAFQKKFYDLIITVDCGISNKEEVDKIIEELGAEIIVTDHHELPAELPNCLCVNPKLGYPFPNLAGAGVAWKVVEALVGREVAAKYSDLAMLGTIGDLMEMVDENRSIVRLGMANYAHKSLVRLTELAGCQIPPSVSDISMKISPRINAAGRMGHPEIGSKVLRARDRVNLADLEKLCQLNDLRKQMTETILTEAEAMCDEVQIRKDRLVFLYGENWGDGLVGLVASRYKEQFYCPSAVMTKKSNGAYGGSARSVDGVDLLEVFNSCQDILETCGGHKASLGFSVMPDNLVELKRRISDKLQQMDAQLFEKKLYYDIDLTNAVVGDMFAFTQKMQPLLPQNKILFRVKDTVQSANAFGKESDHLSVTLSGGLQLKSFYKYSEYAPFIKGGAEIEALISLEFDTYYKTVSGIVEDMHLCNSVCFDAFYKQNFLKNFLPKNVIMTEEKQAIQQLSEAKSALVVFDDYETYLNYCEKFGLQDYFVDIFFDNSLFSKTVAISPNSDYGFEKYDLVVCFAHQGTVRDLPPSTVYVETDGANSDLYSLQLSREICASVYSRIKNKSKFESLRGVYDKYLMNKMSYEQYLVALRVFEELRFIKIHNKYDVEILAAEKSDLTNSAIFRCFNNR